MRILIVTGSRAYPYPEMVRIALNTFFVRHGAFTLYHGDCRDKSGRPCGADHFADAWAATEPHVRVRPFRADWDRYGKPAGPIRNREMVSAAYQSAELGRVHGLAFPYGISKGTRGCMEIMDEFHIPCTTWEAEDAALFLKESR